MSTDHDTAMELLPWYVSGTLAEHERMALERHLQECLPCRAALRDEQRLCGLLRDGETSPLGPAHGLAALLGRIDGARRPRPPWRRPQLAFAAAAATVAIAVWLLLPTAPAPMTGADEGTFSTLTESAAPGASANRLDLVFAEGMDRNDIEELLESLGAEIVSGPSELGRYTVQIPADSGRELSEIIAEYAEYPEIRFVGRNYIQADSPAPADQ